MASPRPWIASRARTIVWQTVVLAGVAAIVALIAWNTAINLRARGIASGFDYLGRMAGFEIAKGPLAYSSRDTYARALAVGLVNTLRVTLLGIALATALGLAIGFARLSSVRPLAVIARGYVEALRNTPLLLQLLFWYSLTQGLPSVSQALHPLPGVFLSNRGLFLPGIAWHGPLTLSLEHPVPASFGFSGGTSISPEFAALLIGLTTYTAAFIGEIVRGGILAVGKGQGEAAAALGLSRAKALRLVVWPQALRMILPPTTSQFLNLTKNSSLAVAIGYPDLMSVTGTSLNQTGQAIEAITVAMLVYLALSLIIALGVSRYPTAHRL